MLFVFQLLLLEKLVNKGLKWENALRIELLVPSNESYFIVYCFVENFGTGKQELYLLKMDLLTLVNNCEKMILGEDEFEPGIKRHFYLKMGKFLGENGEGTENYGVIINEGINLNRENLEYLVKVVYFR